MKLEQLYWHTGHFTQTYVFLLDKLRCELFVLSFWKPLRWLTKKQQIYTGISMLFIIYYTSSFVHLHCDVSRELWSSNITLSLICILSWDIPILKLILSSIGGDTWSWEDCFDTTFTHRRRCVFMKVLMFTQEKKVRLCEIRGSSLAANDATEWVLSHNTGSSMLVMLWS